MKLVSKIAFDIWEADHEAMMVALEENGTPIVVSLIPFRETHSWYMFIIGAHHLLLLSMVWPHSGSLQELLTGPVHQWSHEPSCRFKCCYPT